MRVCNSLEDVTVLQTRVCTRYPIDHSDPSSCSRPLAVGHALCSPNFQRFSTIWLQTSIDSLVDCVPCSLLVYITVWASGLQLMVHDYQNCRRFIRIKAFLSLGTNQPSPWRQIAKVHHRIHKSPSTFPILSQVNPLHTPPTNLPKVHFDPTLPSTPWSFKWPFSFGLSHYFLSEVR
jgi:hypothetical protein